MKLNRGEPDHPHWKSPFTPKEKALFWLGVGACFLVLGWMDWVNPPMPPFTGRWGWVAATAHNALGIHGPTIVYWVLGGLMVAVGASQWLSARLQNNAR